MSKGNGGSEWGYELGVSGLDLVQGSVSYYYKSHGIIKVLDKEVTCQYYNLRNHHACGMELDRWEARVNEMSWGLLSRWRSRDNNSSGNYTTLKWCEINSLGIVQRASNVSAHLIFRLVLWGRCHHYPHFIDEEAAKLGDGSGDVIQWTDWRCI